MFNNSSEKNRYSLRKLSVGLASVLIGISFIEANGQTAKADTVDGGNTAAISTKVEKTTNASDANKGTTASNDNLGAAGNANAEQESAKENGSQNYNANDSAEATAAKTEAVKSTIIAAKAALDAEVGTQKANTPVTNQANTDAKGAVNEARTSSAEQQSRDNTAQTANGGASASGNESATTLLQKAAQAVKNVVTENAKDAQTADKDTQTLDANKNSQKLAKKVLATNLIETNSSAMTNGGFDEATWGKLNVYNWYGHVQNGVYQLTDYTGDPSHIIVPNEADFEKAGKSTNGLQVGIDSGTVESLLSKNQGRITIAFSKTNNKKVKAIGTDWSFAFSSGLTKFDGSNWDISNITNMSAMFYDNEISDLTSLANWNVSNVTDMSMMFYRASDSGLDLTPLANWDTSNVTDMHSMFDNTKVSDLTPLANWDTSKVTSMYWMFAYNSISDLSPLAHWKTSKVTDMSDMFDHNSISDLTSLANWDTSNVTDMSNMFVSNKVSDLTPLANWDTNKVTNMSGMFGSNKVNDLTSLAKWNTSNVTDMSRMFASNPDIINLSPIAKWNISSVKNDKGLLDLFDGDNKLNLTNINNTPLMQGFLKEPDALQGATYITNNADLVKTTTGKDLPDSTNTAKRTITFNIPDATPETIVQTINYKAITTVQVNFDNKQIVKTYPVKESDWQLDDSKHNDAIIVNGQIRFKAVKIPHIPGYKAIWTPAKDSSDNSAQAASYSISFIALPDQGQDNNGSKDDHDTTPTDPVQPVNPSDDAKHDSGNVEVPAIPSDPKDNQDITAPDEPEVPTVPVDTDAAKDIPASDDASDVITMDKPANAPVNAEMYVTDSAWHIKDEATTDTSYTVVNSEHKLQLPRFTGYTLRLVKRDAARDAISFVYVNPNKTLKYIFNIKFANGKYILTIGKVTEDGIMQLKKVTFSNYNQLIALIAKAVNR